MNIYYREQTTHIHKVLVYYMFLNLVRNDMSNVLDVLSLKLRQ